jgi:hypothetical protein
LSPVGPYSVSGREFPASSGCTAGREAEQMIAVEMGNKNLIQLSWVVRGMQKLMLGPFSAVEQPHLRCRRLLQIQHDRRHITCTGRHACGCPQKCQFHRPVSSGRG